MTQSNERFIRLPILSWIRKLVRGATYECRVRSARSIADWQRFESLEDRTTPTVKVFTDAFLGTQVGPNFTGPSAINNAIAAGTTLAGHYVLVDNDEITPYSDFIVTKSLTIEPARDSFPLTNPGVRPLVDSGDSFANGFTIEFSAGLNGATVKGLEIANSDVNLNIAIKVGNTAQNILIDDMEVHDHTRGIDIGTDVEFVTISNSDIHDNFNEGILSRTGVQNLTVEGNSIVGHIRGIDILTNTNYVDILRNTIENTTTDGIRFNGGSIDNIVMSENTFDNNANGGTAISAAVRFSTSFGTTTNATNLFTKNSFINNVNNAGAVNNPTVYIVNFSGCWWDSATGPSGGYSGTGNKITTHVDFSPWLQHATDQDGGTIGFQGNFGYLNVDDASPNATGAAATGYLQEAVVALQTGTSPVYAGNARTIDVRNGTYFENNVAVNKAATIRGQSQAGVIVAPSVVDAHLDDSFAGSPVNAFFVSVDSVNIEDLTIDGNANGSLSGNNNFRAGIMTPDNLVDLSNLTFDNLVVKNIYRRAIQINWTGDNNAITNNTVTQNSGALSAGGAGIAVFGPFGSVTVATLISNNTVTNTAASGVISNFGALLTIKKNTVTNSPVGMNLASMAAGSFVGGPTAGTAGVGGTGDGNLITMNGSGQIGMLVTFSPGLVTVQNNSVSGSATDAGLWLFHNAAVATQVLDNTFSATGSVAGASGESTGIYVTDFVNGEGTPAGNLATILRNSITGFHTGIDINAQRVQTTSITVTIGGATAADNNVISGTGAAGTGIRVYDADGSTNGYEANATIQNNSLSITGFAVGVDVDGGSAAVTGNAIYQNTTGVRFRNLGTGSLTGNDFDDATDNATDLRLDANAGAVTIAAGNQFAGDTFFIDNLSTQDYLLTGGNAQFYDESNDFRIEDKMHHEVDTDLALGTGLITWVAGNVFITDAGTDHSIQRGVDVATAGDTVNVEAGTYIENVAVGKRLTIDGAGSTASDTVVKSATIDVPVFTYTVGGVNAVTRQTIKDIRIQDGFSATPGAQGASGILYTTSSASGYFTLDNVVSTNNVGHGLVFNNSSNISDVAIVNSAFSNNSNGILIRGGGYLFDGLSISGSSFTGNDVLGFSFNPNQNSSLNGDNFSITTTTFTQNGDLSYTQPVSPVPQLGRGDIGFQFYNGNATLTDVTVNGLPTNGAHIGVQFRGDNVVAPAGTITLTNVTISGSYVRPLNHPTLGGGPGGGLYIQNYTDVSGFSFNNVDLLTTEGHQLFVAGVTNTLNLGATDFGATLGAGGFHIALGTTSQNIGALSPVDATGAFFGGVNGVSATLTQLYTIENNILHGVDDPALGLVRVKANRTFVTPNSFFAPATTVANIQRAINLASSGDTVHVQGGSYTGNVTGAGKAITLDLGASTALVSITGDFTLDSDDTLVLEIDGTTPGSLHDQLVVAGAVSLGSSILTTFSSIASVPGQTLTILANDGGDAITGIFGVYNEGATVVVNGINFVISYAGGTGNDVSLTQPGDFVWTETVAGSDFELLLLENGVIDTLQLLRNGIAVDSRPFNAVTSFVLNGIAADTDTFKVNYSATGGYFSLPVFFHGGAAGNDMLAVVGSGQNATYSPDLAVPGNGTVVVDSSTITFTGLEPVDISGMLTATLLTLGANDLLTVANGFDFATSTVNAMNVFGTSGGVGIEAVAFWNNTTVVIDTTFNDGVDSILVAGINGIAQNNANVTISTGVGADALTVSIVVNLTGTFTANVSTVNLNANITAATITGTATTVYVDDNPSGQIQDGIDVAAPGATVNVLAGTFNENVRVNEQVTIVGAGEASTFVRPSFSGANPGGLGSLPLGHSSVFLIQADNVTIRDLTVDGDNPGLTSGIVIGGADIDARNGIITDHTMFATIANLTVDDVTVKNIYLRGIYASTSAGTFTFTDNTVQNVRGDAQSIAIFNFGGSGLIQNNFVTDANDGIAANWSRGTQFLNNIVTNSDSGIHTDNAGGAGGTNDLIQLNQVLNGSYPGGSYGIFVFAPYLSVTVDQNTVTDVDVGLGAFGGFGGSALFTDNTVDANNRAGSLGAWVSTTLFGFGSANVDASFTANNTIFNADTGIQVDEEVGYVATVLVSGNNLSIYGNLIGIDVTGGTVTITNNTIYDNGIGIRFGTGGAGSVTGNNFDDATDDNDTDLQILSTAGAVAVGAANNFAGDVFYIDNQSTQDFDLVTFVQTYDVAGVDVNFRIEDLMHHRMDDDLAVSNGLITWVANNLFVTDAGTDHDIQRGVDAATAGNIVNVETGTYAPTVVQPPSVGGNPAGLIAVNKSVTIIGIDTGLGLPTITSSAAGAAPGIGRAIFDVSAPNVLLQDLLINVVRPNATAGIQAFTSFGGLTIDGVTMRSFGSGGFYAPPTPAGPPATSSAGISIMNIDGGSPLVTITDTAVLPDNNITPTSIFGRAVYLQTTRATISGNPLFHAFVGVGQDLQITDASAGVTSISGILFPSAGVSIVGTLTGATVNLTGNVFDQPSIGLPFFPDKSLAISTSSLGTVNVENNVFQDVQSGKFAVVSGASKNVTIKGNLFTAAAGAVNFTYILTTSSYLSSNPTVVIPDNSITIIGNTFSAAGGTSGRALDFQHGNTSGASGWGTITIGTATPGEENTFGDLAEFIRLSPTPIPSPTVVNLFPGAFAPNLNVANNEFDFGGGPLFPASFTLADNFAMENRVFHKIDNGTVGLVLWTANNVYVTPAAVPTATDNDYTRLRNALDAVADGYTINLLGTFNWVEANAAASWALGNDDTASTTDDYSLRVPVGLDSVTFTAPGGLGTATIQGPGDLATVNLEGVLLFDQGVHQNWTISNLQFYDFDLSIAFFATGVSDFNGTQVLNNRIRIPVDLNATVAPIDVNQNIGIHYSFGTNQTFAGNIFELIGAGVSDSANNRFSTRVAMQSNTSGGAVYDGLLIDNNVTNVYDAQFAANPELILGIWENAHAHSSDIVVSNNQFNNLHVGNDPTINLQRAFRVTSHSSASTTVTYSGNTVNGANMGFQWIAGTNFAGNLPVQLLGNTLNDVNTGVLVQSNGLAHLSNNDLTNTGSMLGLGTAVSVASGSTIYLDDAVDDNNLIGFATAVLVNGAATISGNDNSIHDNVIGIDVAGGTATISGNHIYDNGIGIRFGTGGAGSVTGNDFDDATDDNDTDLQILSTAGAVAVGAANNFAGDVFYIDNQSTQDFDLVTFAQTYDVSGVDVNYRIEDLMHHRVDTDLLVTNGLITWVANNLFVTDAGTDHNIQRGIDAASAGNTVNIEDGSYVESNILVNKSLTLLGQSQAGVVISPTGVDSHADSTLGGSPIDGFRVGAPNVTINTLTIDGGAGLDFRHGIIAHDAYGWTGGGLTVTNVAVENIYRKGVALYFTAPGKTTGNFITNNSFDTVGTTSTAFEAVAAIAVFQSDATITGNVITNSAAGVLSNYFTTDADAPLLDVSFNNFSFPLTAGGMRAIGLDISGAADNSVIHNNTINMTGGTLQDIGIVLQYVASLADVAVYDNPITVGAGDVGIMLYANADLAHSPLIDNNTITGSGSSIGILLTDDGSIFGETPNVGTTYGVLTRNVISGFTTGIALTSAGSTPVYALIGGLPTDDNSITGGGAGTGILVSGANSSATIQNNNVSIHGFAVGIDVDGGSATITSNHIYDNTTGIVFRNSGTGSVTGNNFNDANDNDTDLQIQASAGAVAINAANNFAGDVFYIDDLSTQNYDLTGANSQTYDVAGPDVNFRIEDRMHHRVDTDLLVGNGRIIWVSNNLYVTDLGTDHDIQRGVDAADPTGFTVNVEAGSYLLLSPVNINKEVTLLGAQSGVDARTRTLVPESIVDATAVTGYPTAVFRVLAGVGGVVIDGFTLQNAVGGFAEGAISLAPTSYGTTIQNNIIRNNTVGIFLANDSAVDATVVFQNLFIDNTQPGPASGHSIYADNFTAGAMQNVSIEDNKFTNTAFTLGSWAIGLGSFGGTPFADITIDGNEIVNHGRGMYFYHTTGTNIWNNIVTGATRYAVGIFGANGVAANSNFSVDGNTFASNGKSVYIEADTAADAYTGGTLSLTNNSFTTVGAEISIYNDSNTRVDATDNVFNGVDVSLPTTTAQQYAIVDTIVDAVDIGAHPTGLVVTKAGHVYVTTNSFFEDLILSLPYTQPGTTQPDIQRAVNAASNGDVVHIQGGVYFGSVNTTAVSVTLDLGASPAQVTVNGDWTLDGDDTLAVEFVDNTAAGVDYDQLVVNGLVDLGGAALAPSIGSGLINIADSFTLIANNLVDPVTGIFAGKPQASTFMVGAQFFVIFYNGGTGNDVVLMRVPALTPTQVWVDDSWVGTTAGVDADGVGGGVLGNGYAFGYDQFAVIQDGVNAVAAAGTVWVYAGSYPENVVVNKSLNLWGEQYLVNPVTTIRGFEATISPVSGTGVLVTVAAPVSIRGFEIIADSGISDPGADLDVQYNVVTASTVGVGTGVAISSANSAVVSNNVIDDFLWGVYGFTVATNVDIQGNAIGNVAIGIYLNDVGGTAQIGGLTAGEENTIVGSGAATDDGIVVIDTAVVFIEGNDVSGVGYGVYLYSAGSSGDPVDVTSNDLTGVNAGVGVWLDGSLGSAYADLLGNNIAAYVFGVFLFSSGGNTVEATIGGPLPADSNDIIGFAGADTGVRVEGANSTADITGNVTSIHGFQFGVDVSGASASISGNHIYDNDFGIRFANGGSGSVFGNDFNDAVIDVGLDNDTDLRVNSTAGAVSVVGAANSFAGDDYFIDNRSAQAFDLVANPQTYEGYNPLLLPFANNDNFGIEDHMYHKLDNAGSGLIRWSTGRLFVTTPGGLSDELLQNAVDASGTGGDIVYVQAGTYVQEVNVNKDNLQLLGAAAGTTTLSGPIGGDSATVRVSANNVEVTGFTITREGNNSIDWFNPALKSAGIAIIGTSLTGMLVHDNILTGNRTAIDVNNTSGHTIRNNVIDYNRTGLLFRNQTDNLLVTQNDITNNWTMGVLFLDASGGSNIPVQTALNSSFTNNNISGNWYAGVVDRQSGGSLPAPGTTNLKNFSGNWWGTNAPVPTMANSAEMGYGTSPIPAGYPGGSATNPGGAPDIAGPASGNIDFTPWLDSPVDTNVDTGFGTFGFQGNFNNLWVTSSIYSGLSNAQTGASGRIQEGHDLATAGGLVHILGGAYTENLDTTNQSKAVTLSPGASPAQVTVNGNFKLDADITVVMELNGAAPGTGYDQFVINGTLDLGNAFLSVTRTHVYTIGSQIVLFNNDLADITPNTFNGYPEGSTVIATGVPFTISYVGLTGNDVVLDLNFQPTTWVNDDWVILVDSDFSSSLTYGDIVNSNGGNDPVVLGKVFGVDAFNTLQSGHDALIPVGGVEYVMTGSYAQNLSVSKSNTTVTALIGTAPATVNPAAGTAISILASGVTLNSSSGADDFVVQGNAVAGRTGVQVGSTGATLQDLKVQGFTGSSSTGVRVTAGNSATMLSNTIQTNNVGVRVVSGTALLQSNAMPNNNSNGANSAAVVVQGDSLVDLGQSIDGSQTNYTGLGISTGGNTFNYSATPGVGYWMGGSQAIVNINADAGLPSGPNNVTFPNVSARNNDFGTTVYGNIERIVNHSLDSPFIAFVDYRDAVGAVAPQVEGLPRYYALTPTESLSAQRSIIRGIQIVVDSPVVLGGSALDLVRRLSVANTYYTSGGTPVYPGAVPANQLPTGVVATAVVSSINGTTGRTTIDVTFTGPTLSGGGMLENVGGSLLDGRYRTTLNANAIDLLFSGQTAPSAKFNSGTNVQQDFHRMFGDLNGNTNVSAIENANFNDAFNNAFSAYQPYFDFDLDGSAFSDLFDRAEFLKRVGKTLPNAL